MVNEQANDIALWFDAETVSEAYLQQALRALHGVLENDIAGQVASRMYTRAVDDQ